MAKKRIEELMEELQKLLPPGCSVTVSNPVPASGSAVVSEDDIDLGGPAEPEEEPEGEEPEGEDEGEEEEEEEPEDDNWKKGDRCQVKIDGEYYPGKVDKIDEKKDRDST